MLSSSQKSRNTKRPTRGVGVLRYLLGLSQKMGYVGLGLALSLVTATAFAAWNTPVTTGSALTATIWNDLVTQVQSISTAVSGLGTFATKSTATSADITDGTIADADISNTAAIANSKIAGLGSLATKSAVATADITDSTIANADISATAAIANTKIAGLGTFATKSTATTTDITDGTLADADVSATAAIAGTKVSPNFGSQNVVTTGKVSAADPVGDSDLSTKLYVDQQVAAAGGGSSSTVHAISSRPGPLYVWGAAAQYCRTLSEGGYTDWHLPTFDELTYALAYLGTDINSAALETSGYFYWTSTPADMRVYQTAQYNYWLVLGADGIWTVGDYIGARPVRCVR